MAITNHEKGGSIFMTHEEFMRMYGSSLEHAGHIYSKDPSKYAEQKKREKIYNHQYYINHPEKWGRTSLDYEKEKLYNTNPGEYFRRYGNTPPTVKRPSDAELMELYKQGKVSKEYMEEMGLIKSNNNTTSKKTSDDELMELYKQGKVSKEYMEAKGLIEPDTKTSSKKTSDNSSTKSKNNYRFTYNPSTGTTMIVSDPKATAKKSIVENFIDSYKVGLTTIRDAAKKITSKAKSFISKLFSK